MQSIYTHWISYSHVLHIMCILLKRSAGVSV